MLNAKEFKDFLSFEETANILDFARNTNSWANAGHEFWDGRIINTFMIENKNIQNTMYNIKSRAAEKIKKAYSLTTDIYPDLFQITRWFPGMEQPPHSDDMENTDHSEQNKHREYGAIIYLNDDFVGGRTFYPQHNFEIIPEPGKMAVHPGTTDHMHGVTRVEGGIRYTIASFWTKEKRYFSS
jgi:hypothetical protein